MNLIARYLLKYCKVQPRLSELYMRPVSNDIHIITSQTFWKVGDLPCASKTINYLITIKKLMQLFAFSNTLLFISWCSIYKKKEIFLPFD